MKKSVFGILIVLVLAVVGVFNQKAAGQETGTRAKIKTTVKKVIIPAIDPQTPASLNVTLKPENATIKLSSLLLNPPFNQARIGDSTGASTFEKLKPGKYKLVVSAEDYITQESELTIEPGKNYLLSIQLEPITYTITINTNAESGEVRYAPAKIIGMNPDRSLATAEIGGYCIASIKDRRAVIGGLRQGVYNIVIKPDSPALKSLLTVVDTRAGSDVDEDNDLQITYNVDLSKTDSDKTTERYFALVIGNNNYQSFSKLQTAENDAKEVARILTEKYSFNVKVLPNATRQAIFTEIFNYRKTLGANDSLLIYYAGHGYFDKAVNLAYWIPVDGQKEDPANFISADDLTRQLMAIEANHILIVSDSCYSGAIRNSEIINNTAPSGYERYLLDLKGRKSRTLMASGGNEPVLDGGGGKHSIFAKAFLNGLEQIKQNSFPATELFNTYIFKQVSFNASQIPQYYHLQNSGSEGGDFIFVKRK